RSFAIATYSFSFSIPIKKRPVFWAATHVLPLPQVRSTTMSFLLLYVLIKSSNSDTGFCVGWNFSLSLLYRNILDLCFLSSHKLKMDGYVFDFISLSIFLSSSNGLNPPILSMLYTSISSEYVPSVHKEC